MQEPPTHITACLVSLETLYVFKEQDRPSNTASLRPVISIDTKLQGSRGTEKIAFVVTVGVYQTSGCRIYEASTRTVFQLYGTGDILVWPVHDTDADVLCALAVQAIGHCIGRLSADWDGGQYEIRWPGLNEEAVREVILTQISAVLPTV